MLKGYSSQLEGALCNIPIDVVDVCNKVPRPANSKVIIIVKLKRKWQHRDNVCFEFFFDLGFLWQTFTNHRTAGEGRGHFFNLSLPLPHASKTLWWWNPNNSWKKCWTSRKWQSIILLENGDDNHDSSGMKMKEI